MVRVLLLLETSRTGWLCRQEFTASSLCFSDVLTASATKVKWRDEPWGSLLSILFGIETKGSIILGRRTAKRNSLNDLGHTENLLPDLPPH